MGYAKWTAAAVVAGAFILMATAADAKPPKDCKKEIEEFCADVPSGGGRINACLQEHLPKLSPACSQALEQSRPRRKEKHRFQRSRAPWTDACAGDVQKLCRNIPIGPGSIHQCLLERQAELSIACRGALGVTP